MIEATPMHVLHVEDSPTDALLTREELDQYPQFRLTQVERLDHALRVLSQERCAVILLDLGLPDSQGMDTLMKLHRVAPEVPVVVMTGQDDQAMAVRALQEGAQDYIVKGRTTEFLLDRVLRYAIERNMTKQALLEREELFRGAFEHTGVPMVITDLNNRFLRINNSFAIMFGYSQGEMIGMTMSSVTHPDDIPESLARRVRLLAGDENFFHVEKRYLHRDGHIMWGLTNVSLVRNSSGQPQLYVGQVQDITDRKRAEAERDRLFEESLNLLGRLGFDGRFKHLNPAWERILGYPLAELMDKPFMSIVLPDDREDMDTEIQKLACGLSVESFENRIRCEDGTYRAILWNATPFLDQNCFSVSGHDVTERRRLEARHRQVQQRLNYVVGASPAVLFTLNVDENRVQGISWISSNLQEILGHPPEAALNPEWWLNNVHPEDRDQILKQAEIDLFDFAHATHEYRFRHGDGKYRWMRGEMRLILDATGHPMEVVGSWSDITERRLLEEQFHQAQKMEAVGLLAGGVAHDFNNLLTIISGYSEIMLTTLAANDPIREFVTNISEAGDQAASLTRQLLAFSRKTVLEPRILDLNEVVQKTEKLLRRLIGDDVLLTAVLDPRISRVKVDPDQLGQVLMNLAVNARDAMPQGGNLTVETSMVELDEEYARLRSEVEPGRYILLAMTDTGGGMSPEVQSRIFEPFFTTKGVGKGTGLGLAVVLGIVKQSGGHVAVYSEENRGTVFKLYFPAIDEQADAAGSPSDSIDARGTETVLLVEDEDGVRGLAFLVLQTRGYKVLAARDGNDALRVVAKHQGPIEILVTDVVMPGMGGREVAEVLQPQFPEMKVLYTSGYTDDAVVRHGVLQAESAFLQKPYSPQSLAKKVRQILDQK